MNFLANLVRSNAGYDNHGYSYPLQWDFVTQVAFESVLHVLAQEWPTQLLIAQNEPRVRARLAAHSRDAVAFGVARLDAELDIRDQDCWRMAADHILEDLGLKAQVHEVEFDFVGLDGGNHIVVTRFDGVDLQGLTSEELAAGIESGAYSQEWTLSLLSMIREWNEVFTEDALASVVEGFWADRIAHEVDRMRTPELSSSVWQQQAAAHQQLAFMH